MTQRDIERERYESRQKALRDYNSGLDWAERKGLQKGLINSIEFGLEIKFGHTGGELVAQVRRMKDLDKLEAIQQALRTARTIEEISALVPQFS